MSIKFGCDLGQSSLKFVGAAGALQFASMASLYGGATADFGKKRKGPVIVEGDFGKLYVGHGAHSFGSPIENLDFDRLAGTPEMRAVFLGAMASYMRKYGPFNDSLMLVVGLPLQMLMGEGANVAKFRKNVSAWLAGDHKWIADGKEYELHVDRVELLPQAMGAPIDFALDMNGKAISEERTKALQNECATISIGSNTVELLVTKRDEDTKRFNGGKAIGVRQLWQRVDPYQHYTFGEFDQDLRAGTLPDGYQVTDQHLESWSSEIIGFANSKWSQSYHRFHKIFLVGGGAIMLEKILKAKFNGKSVIPENPVMCIANGLYKAGFGFK
jgi:hypothetical protein